MARDLRYAWRMLRKSPGLSATIVATLALGIGANTAVFSIVDGILLRPLPYKDPSRLVDVVDASTKNPRIPKSFGTYGDFEEYSRHAQSFENMAFATWATGGVTLHRNGQARSILAIPVSEDFFSMLGETAALGRTFESGDLNRGCSVVLSDRFWRQTLAANTGIVGQMLDLDHRACAVLGVMPAQFEFYPRQTQLWLLLTPDDPRPRDQLLVITFARLKPGITAAQAEAELASLHRAMPKPDWHRDFTPVVDSLEDEFRLFAGRNLRATLGLLMAAVALVLLIACLNVASLLLGRAPVRAREFAVRAALGSGRARLFRQLFIEGLLLSGLGAASGVIAAFGAIRYFRHANPIELPVGAAVSINFPVLAFTVLLAIVTALIFGIAPAWAGSRLDVNAGLRAAGRGAIRGAGGSLARGLITSEISLALMLLAGGTLLMRSVLNMSAAPLGFDPNHLMILSTTLPERRYTDSATRLRYYDELNREMNRIPGIDGAAIASAMPPYASGNYEIQIEGKERTRVQDVGFNVVTPDYFRVLRIALQRGRVFDARDRLNSEPVAVINESLAREYFQGADPIGRRIRTLGFKEGAWATIIGVVATEKHPDFMHEMEWHEQPALYRAVAQGPPTYCSIAVRTHVPRQDTGRDIERVMTGIDREVPVGEISTMRDRIGAYVRYPRFRAVVLDAFAAMALLLAVIGLHGLLAQYVTERTQELAVRMAVGAQARDIIWLVAKQASVPVIAGLLIGLALTAGVSRYLVSLLFEIRPLDPPTIAGACLALIGAASLATLKSAIRAISLDPIAALREE